MIRLDTVNRSLTLVLGGAQATAPLQIVVSYSDQTSSTYLGSTQLANSNGTTAVTICSAPIASVIRDIDMVTVLNTDSATQIVTIQLLDTATNYKIITVSLLVGDKLTYTHGSAWQVLDNLGNFKYTVLATTGVNSFSGGSTGLTPATATTGAVTLGGTLAVASGGTGTASPALVAGTNVTITGTWPNQTINSTNTGGTVTSVAATVPSFLSIAGSPITTSGTLAISYSGTALPPANGGTGIANNAASTLTISGNFGTTLTVSATTAVTLPTSGTLATLAGSETFTNKTLTNPTVTNYVETLQAVGTVGASSTLALTNGTVLTATLTASTPCTFTMPTATAGKSFILILTQAASGMTTATFTGVKFPGGTAPTITATASAVDIISFVANGSVWYGNYVQAFA